MLIALLGGFVWWHWLVLAMLLLVIELAVPIMWFLWVAVGAGILALLTLLFPDIPWPWQLILFGVISIASLFIGRQLFRGNPVHDAPALNRRGEQHVGKIFTLVEPIVNGKGAARVGDTQWRVAGSDLPVGTRVQVTHVDGNQLQVVEHGAGDTPAPRG